MEPAPDNGEAMDKTQDAFRTISEVAEDLQIPQHVLRFWETRFTHIRPLKRGGGRRYYRREDVELLKAIRQLLYSDGYTIRGVHRLLKEKGVRAVVAMAQQAGGLTAAPQVEPPMLAREVDPSPTQPGASLPHEPIRHDDPPLHAQNPPSRAIAAGAIAAGTGPDRDKTGGDRASGLASSGYAAEWQERSRERSQERPLDAPTAPLLSAPAYPSQPFSTLTPTDRRRLDAVLFELFECRRILSAASA